MELDDHFRHRMLFLFDLGNSSREAAEAIFRAYEENNIKNSIKTRTKSLKSSLISAVFDRILSIRPKNCFGGFT
jgi:hypothetical protein